LCREVHHNAPATRELPKPGELDARPLGEKFDRASHARRLSYLNLPPVPVEMATQSADLPDASTGNFKGPKRSDDQVDLVDEEAALCLIGQKRPRIPGDYAIDQVKQCVRIRNVVDVLQDVSELPHFCRGIRSQAVVVV
jgi:hypothetical protein